MAGIRSGSDLAHVGRVDELLHWPRTEPGQIQRRKGGKGGERRRDGSCSFAVGGRRWGCDKEVPASMWQTKKKATGGG